MTVQEWESIHATLRIQMQDDWRMLPKTTVADVQAFEAEFCLRLPDSYRTYVVVFGAGELAFEYDIPAPGYSSSPTWNLSQFSKHSKDYYTDVAEYYDNSELVAKLVYFASSNGGLAFGWDISDIRSINSQEYAIYLVSNSEDPVLIATSFGDFIQWCLADAAENRERMAFCPAHELASP